MKEPRPRGAPAARPRQGNHGPRPFCVFCRSGWSVGVVVISPCFDWSWTWLAEQHAAAPGTPSPMMMQRAGAGRAMIFPARGDIIIMVGRWGGEGGRIGGGGGRLGRGWLRGAIRAGGGRAGGGDMDGRGHLGRRRRRRVSPGGATPGPVGWGLVRAGVCAGVLLERRADSRLAGLRFRLGRGCPPFGTSRKVGPVEVQGGCREFPGEAVRNAEVVHSTRPGFVLDFSPPRSLLELLDASALAPEVRSTGAPSVVVFRRAVNGRRQAPRRRSGATSVKKNGEGHEPRVFLVF